MFKRFGLGFLLALALATPAAAQNVQCPTRPPGDNSNACASTAFVTTSTANIFAQPHTWTAEQTFAGGTSTNPAIVSTGPISFINGVQTSPASLPAFYFEDDTTQSTTYTAFAINATHFTTSSAINSAWTALVPQMSCQNLGSTDFCVGEQPIANGVVGGVSNSGNYVASNPTVNPLTGLSPQSIVVVEPNSFAVVNAATIKNFVRAADFGTGDTAQTNKQMWSVAYKGIKTTTAAGFGAVFGADGEGVAQQEPWQVGGVVLYASEASGGNQLSAMIDGSGLVSGFSVAGIYLPANVTEMSFGASHAGGGIVSATASGGINLNFISGGIQVTSGSFGLTGSFNAALSTSGTRYVNVPGTITDTTTGAGTVAAAYTDVFGGNTIATQTNAVTVTNYYGSYFKAPVAGSHITFTNSWALGADSLNVNGTIAQNGTSIGTGPFLPLAGGTMAGNIAMGGNNISGGGTFTAVTMNATTGFQLNGAATSANVLRGNGTNFVSAALAAADLSNGVTGSGAVVLAAGNPALTWTFATDTSATSFAPIWTLVNTTADANAGAFQLQKTHGAGVGVSVNDVLGNINFQGLDSTPTSQRIAGSIQVAATAVGASSVDGGMVFNVNGTTSFIRIRTNNSTVGQWYASGGLYVGGTIADPGANNLQVQGVVGIGTAPLAKNGLFIGPTLTFASNSASGLVSSATVPTAGITGSTFNSIKVDGTITTGANTLTQYNGIVIDDVAVNGNSITTTIGLAINSIASGGTNYAIKTNAGIIAFGDATDASSTTVAAVTVAGGLAVVKKLYVGGITNVATTSAVCYNTGTGLLTYDGTIGTCTVSDERFKTFDGPISDPLGKLVSLSRDEHFGYFHGKGDKGQQLFPRESIGLGAQTVGKYFPELIAKGDDGYYSLAYDKLTVPIIAAIADLKADNDNLRQRVEYLERRIAR